MKVLLVEDDANLRRALVHQIRRMFPDVVVWTAVSANEAIDHLCDAMVDKPIDFVICDYNLNGPRTGADVLEWIQTHASYLESRFLFLSGDVRVRQLHSNFLEKPCEPEKLRAVIEASISSRS